MEKTREGQRQGCVFQMGDTAHGEADKRRGAWHIPEAECVWYGVMVMS